MHNLIINITLTIIISIMLGGCDFKQGISTIEGFEMVAVEGGTFDLGNQVLDESEMDENPVHSVTVSDFYIGKTEVTQKQWSDIMGFLPKNLIFGEGDNYPIYNVSWDDIQMFLKKLEEKTNKKFRLPTEAEWEYACRGGKYSTNCKYSGSNELSLVAWFCKNSGKKELNDEEYNYNFLKINNSSTHPVGMLQPNELGIYDMNGNVWEWCYDLYGEYPSSSQKNPIGSLKGFKHVIRGGSFSDISFMCRISNRGKTYQYTRTCDLGFRVVFPK